MQKETYYKILNKVALSTAKELSKLYQAGWYAHFTPAIVHQEAYKRLIKSPAYVHFGQYNKTAKADLQPIAEDLYDKIIMGAKLWQHYLKVPLLGVYESYTGQLLIA